MDPLRVLVVDDDEVVRYPLEEFFRFRNEPCTLAASGEEAVRLLEAADFDLMITDISMPGMSGLRLITEARRLHPHLVCIVLSGTGTRRDLITAIKNGAFDYLEKPIPDFATFSVIIDRAAERSRMIREREALMQELKVQNTKLEVSLRQLHDAFGRLRLQEKTLENDLRQAQRMQRKLLPDSLPPLPGLELFGFYGPCERLGGDFFGIVPLGEGKTALYLVDVAGHGVSAALITVILRELLHARRMLHPGSGILSDPGRTLAFLNQGLLEEAFDPPILVTMVFVVLDAVSGEAVCACAGHPPPIVVAGESGGRLLPAGGPVLGIASRSPYETATVRLAPNDFLLLYSDGLSEARDRDGVEYGEKRLARSAADAYGLSAARAGARIEADLLAHTDRVAPADDRTFLLARRMDPARAEADADPPTESVKFVFPSEIQQEQPNVHGRIEYGWTSSTCTIRLRDLGTWQLGAPLLDLIREAESRGLRRICVDLEKCLALDSTMLGLLYQFADRIILHRPSEEIRAQLLEMGILERFSLSPEAPPTVAFDVAVEAASGVPQESCSELILSAHEALMEVSDVNRRRFSGIVESIRRDG